MGAGIVDMILVDLMVAAGRAAPGHGAELNARIAVLSQLRLSKGGIGPRFYLPRPDDDAERMDRETMLLEGPILGRALAWLQHQGAIRYDAGTATWHANGDAPAHVAGNPGSSATFRNAQDNCPTHKVGLPPADPDFEA